ncbi:4-hydroxybenzoate polyprenyl transferase [Plasmodium fragile]|uniref:4-hydroxybenzoate polyprenyl transferase n=1 Tax=Plasmodium fragile TaxID=5857 RepID=A0A0D9QPS1_PLAFR|nr:4-hydroxybenzoate polyprenyl transferase [Plasmodium fragile]KJP88938.1 4-hydroxybenzoate polyprenyl transferase [Plasmodium fragile]
MHVKLGKLLIKSGGPKWGQRMSPLPRTEAPQTVRSLSKGLPSIKSIPVKGVSTLFFLHPGKERKEGLSPPKCNGIGETCRGKGVVGIASRTMHHPIRSNQCKGNSNRRRAMMICRYYCVSAGGGKKSQKGKFKVDRRNHVDNPARYPSNHMCNHHSAYCSIPLPDKVKQNLTAYITLSRLHIPTGMHLLFNSALYGYFLTLPVENLFTPGNELNWDSLYKIGRDISLFAFGSLNSRIVGCIINDLFDRNYDKHVERTKNRPLANNTVTMARAFTYLAIHSALCLLTLFQFSTQTIYTGLLSTAFIISYPLMKRITYYAQVYLSITFNLGFLIASSVHVQLATNVLPLCVCFLPLCYLTVIYDTIYAHQDKSDDIRLNLKSLAIKWGDKTLSYSKLLAVNMVYLFYLSGYLLDLHYSYYLLSTCNVLYLLHCISKTSLDDRDKCMAFFKNSKNILMLFVLSAVVAKGCEAYHTHNTYQTQQTQHTKQTQQTKQTLGEATRSDAPTSREDNHTEVKQEGTT